MNIKSFSFPKNRSSNDHIIMETEIPVTFRWKLEFQSFPDENWNSTQLSGWNLEF